MKKIVSTALALSLLATGAAAFAQEEAKNPVEIIPISAAIESDGEMHTIANLNDPSLIQIGDQSVRIRALNQLPLSKQFGTVSFIGDEEPRIMLMGENEEGEQEAKLILNTDEATLILDATTGEAVAYEDIKEGDLVYAYTSPMMAMSYPPQSYARLLLVNIEKDTIVPAYAEVNRVERDEETGVVTLITNQNVNIKLTDDTAVSPYLTRQLLTKDTIQAGQMILAWYPVQMNSFPAQATATKVIAFNTTYNGSFQIDSEGALFLNGEVILFDRLAMPYADEETCMLPLRKLAETLGYTVTWEGETSSVTVSREDGTELYRFRIGAETVMVDGDTERYMAHTADITLGVTYISADDFITLHNLKAIG